MAGHYTSQKSNANLDSRLAFSIFVMYNTIIACITQAVDTSEIRAIFHMGWPYFLLGQVCSLHLKNFSCHF